MKGSCFDLPGNLTGLITAFAVIGVQEDGHGRCRRLFSGVHDFDKTRQTKSNVDFSHTCVVEGTHGHLRARFTDGVGGIDTDCFTGLNTGAFILGVDPCDDVLEVVFGYFLAGIML